VFNTFVATSPILSDVATNAFVGLRHPDMGDVLLVRSFLLYDGTRKNVIG